MAEPVLATTTASLIVGIALIVLGILGMAAGIAGSSPAPPITDASPALAARRHDDSRPFLPLH
jgi:hypothetical protein